MAFDFSGTLAASRQLSRKNAELSTLKQALSRYQSQLHAAWSGPEVQQIDRAISRLQEKIRRAQIEIDGVCRDMNSGAARLKNQEDTARAAAELRAGLSRGGGGVR